jgi:phage terminase large subunit-like protein
VTVTEPDELLGPERPDPQAVIATALSKVLRLPASDLSQMEALALLPAAERTAKLQRLTNAEAASLRYDWGFHGRPDQQWPHGWWRVLLLLSGRGTGKTRTGAELTRKRAMTGRPSRGVLVAPTPADARDLMVEGEAGILLISPDGERPKYEPSKMRLTWPNGTVATIRSAADPEAIRGGTYDWAWCEEMAKWRHIEAAWNNLRFSMRRGTNPQTWITTTPKPYDLLRRIAAGTWKGTVVRRVPTYRNIANLAPEFIEELLLRYEGSRLGLQELWGQFLDDVEGALFTMAEIEAGRVAADADGVVHVPNMRRIVVAIDPSWGIHGDECGIVVAGLGWDGRGYVLDDLSCRAKPAEWGAIAAEAYDTWQADRIVAEANFQAEQVRLVMQVVSESKGRNYHFKEVHASRGKALRAEPIQGLYQQGRVSHVGRFGLLESQMTQWVPPVPGQRPDFSPDRLDALVWALTEVMVDGAPAAASTSRPGRDRRVGNGTTGGSARPVARRRMVPGLQLVQGLVVPERERIVVVTRQLPTAA